MKHATPEALDRLETLLMELRRLGLLREKNRGVFYRGAQAFLHFHEDPAGLFADVRLEGRGFTRMRVSTPTEHKRLMSAVRRVLSGRSAPARGK